MSLKWVAVAIALAVAAIVGYGTWMRMLSPARVISQGSVEVLVRATDTGVFVSAACPLRTTRHTGLSCNPTRANTAS